MAVFSREARATRARKQNGSTAPFSHGQMIRHLNISHNSPYLPPKILHNLGISFLQGITAVPREIKNNAYAKCWRANKVHYGRWACGVYTHTFGYFSLTRHPHYLRAWNVQATRVLPPMLAIFLVPKAMALVPTGQKFKNSYKNIFCIFVQTKCTFVTT